MPDVLRPLVALALVFPSLVVMATFVSEDMAKVGATPEVAAAATTEPSTTTTTVAERAVGNEVASRGDVATTSTTRETSPPRANVRASRSSNSRSSANSSVPTPVPGGAGNSRIASALLDALNRERSARGLSPLRSDPSLTSMAVEWSGHLADIRSLQHRSAKLGSGGLSNFNAFGENVFKGTTQTSAQEIHRAWMNSTGHRNNILQPGFDRVGIGIICDSTGVYATQEFGHASSSGAAQLSSSIPSGPLAPWVGPSPSC